MSISISFSTLRYNINVRRKEAIVHSILQSQHDIKATIAAVTTFTETLNDLAGLHTPATRSLLDHINLFLYSVQAQLTRSIDIALAHSEVVDPTSIRSPDPDNIPPPNTTPQDRIFLLPLQTEILEDPNLGDINHIVNPSEYTPEDADFKYSTNFADCQFYTEPTVYIHSSETEHDHLSPRFKLPFKEPDELNKFYCRLPSPSEAPPTCPDKGNALDKLGNPFFKKLQVNDCVYSPTAKAFAKVSSWNPESVQVVVISKYRSYEELFEDPSSFSSFESDWQFGDFCIALNHLEVQNFLAYVSPFTRADSHPFLSDPLPDPATLAPEPVNTKRKLN